MVYHFLLFSSDISISGGNSDFTTLRLPNEVKKGFLK